VIHWSAPLDEGTKRDVAPLLDKGGPDIVAWVVDPLGGYVDRRTIDEYPKLKFLATPSTGTNHIDLKACKKRGIRVISLLDDRYGLEKITSSAEHTLWMLLTLFRSPPAHEISGRLIGLVGHGRIGRYMERYLHALGCNTHYHDPARANSVPLRDIFQKSDGVVICCALTPKTEGMVGKKLLRIMRNGACLVNTSRGEVVKEDELLDILADRPDIRVAVDVATGEVHGTADWERLMKAGVFCTPHRAGSAVEANRKAALIIAKLLGELVL